MFTIREIAVVSDKVNKAEAAEDIVYVRNVGIQSTHRPGIPCKSLICPDCNVSLLRSEYPGH